MVLRDDVLCSAPELYAPEGLAEAPEVLDPPAQHAAREVQDVRVRD